MGIHDVIIFIVIAVIVIFQLTFFVSNYRAIESYRKSLKQTDELKIVDENNSEIEKESITENNTLFSANITEPLEVGEFPF